MSLSRDIESSMTFVKSEEPGFITAQFCFSPDLPLFKGHFPAKPLVPGVVEIEMAKVALEKLTALRYHLTKVKKAKFIREVLPGDVIDMAGTKGEECSEIRLKVEFRVASQLVASLSILLRQEN